MYFFSVYFGVIFKLGYKPWWWGIFYSLQKRYAEFLTLSFPQRTHYLMHKPGKKKIDVYNNNQSVAPSPNYLTLFGKV